MQEFTALDGALLVDKPTGPTSHDVVDAIRRHFGIKKVGHCGTLDPTATGLLIIVLAATKVVRATHGVRTTRSMKGTPSKFGESTGQL